VVTHRDGAGGLFFAGDWKRFALCYRLEWGFLLMLRHREDTTHFIIKFFGDKASRISLRPARA
jgi:hypothetical protein